MEPIIPIPKWFNTWFDTLAEFPPSETKSPPSEAKLPPSEFRNNFQKQFPSLEKAAKKIIDLLIIFGYVNINSVKKILINVKRVQNCYLEQTITLERVYQVYLDSLIKNYSFDEIVIRNKDLYKHISLSSSKMAEDSIKNDIKVYLLSVEFPLQKSIASGCYSVEWIKKFIDPYNQELQETIQFLFQQKTLKDEMPILNVNYQTLLFKHAGIKGYGRSCSWAFLFCLWNPKQSKYVEPLYSLLHAKNNKPSTSNNKPSTSSQNAKPVAKKSANGISQNAELSFQQFVVKSSVVAIFRHEESVLPPIDTIELTFEKLCLSSEIDRQNAVYFIDHLHEQFLQKKFVFSEELGILKRLIPRISDTISPMYDFLHMILCYFRYLSQHDPDPRYRFFLLKALFALPYEKRRHFDKPIRDKFNRPTFRLDWESCLFLTEHFKPPELWGGIFLRQTILQGKKESSYLDLNAQLKVIVEIEELIDMKLPMKMISNLLFLQTFKVNIKDIVKEFIILRQETKTVDEIPALFEKKWEDLHKRFSAQIERDNLQDLIPCVEPENIILENIWQLSFLLQFSAHPDFKPGIQEGLKEMEKTKNGNLIYRNEAKSYPYLLYFSKYLFKLHIDQALVLLNLFVGIKQSYTYNYFHSQIHYRRLLDSLSLDKEDYSEASDEKRKFLQDAIFSMSVEERQQFDYPIKEDYFISPLNLDSSLLQFAKTHPIPLSGWGKIILRSSRSIPAKPEESPFLSIQDLIKLIGMIESYIGSALPLEMCEDLLYFQIVHPSMFEIVKKCVELHKTIKGKYLSSITIPSSIYSEITDLAARIVYEGFGNLIDFKNLWCTSSRSDFFQSHVVGKLSCMLSHVTYLRPYIPFDHLIAFHLKMKKPPKHKPYHFFQPLTHTLPDGPAWMARWMLDLKKETYSLVVIMTNSLNLNRSEDSRFSRSSCLFHIPLKVPLDEDKKNKYFALLFSAVGGLAKEVYTEKEEVKVNRRKTHSSSNEEALDENPVRRTLQRLLNDSPLIQEEWTKYFLEDTSTDPLDLYSFIETLRTHFLRSFYYILNPKEKSILNTSCIETPFSIEEEGICLSVQALRSHFNFNTIVLDKIWIKKKDHDEQFQEIFRELAAKKSLYINQFLSKEDPHPLQESPSATFRFCLRLRDQVKLYYWKTELEWKGDYDWDHSTPDQSKVICTGETVKMTIHFSRVISELGLVDSENGIESLSDSPQSLIIQYPPFTGEKEFIHSLLWHTALFCMGKGDLTQGT